MVTMNGWSDARESSVTRIVVGDDANGATVRDGDVARAFVWLLEQLHERVEKVAVVNGWRSRAFNTQVGGAAGSNHISGTAVDVNGARHPFELHQPRGTPYVSGFSAAQERAVRDVLRDAGGLFVWGLDFPRGRRDAMHFELARGTTLADVRAFVGRVTEQKSGPVPEEDDMPTVDEIARAVWGYKNRELERVDTYALLRRTNANAQAAAKGVVDVKLLAEAIARALPAGAMTKAQVNRVARVAAKDVLRQA
ncbi:D-Ala-D-Ala carboxypeptidase family metallohydrolase [Cellulomonas sp. CW35]|uniref:Peptidase M15A C-terminal domain-containing protein n=1 Tax=Cellulomonas uda TaxID=1714 RepID=A0A4Y3KEU0_CELUD|nr:MULTISPECIES: D-Ala-D-Ala carboxypeptidase family metallohydrolase [Cellulomonas]NII65127.1 hypothetical protein [Cellulomonas uda]GEA82492.1 hypothetical protein CUD01_29360 [Cellulomonas uda]